MTTVPESGSLMIASCSAWIVVTMSRIVEPRGAFSAASSAGSEADPESASAAAPPSNTSSWRSATRSRGAVPASWKWRGLVTPSGVANVAKDWFQSRTTPLRIAFSSASAQSVGGTRSHLLISANTPRACWRGSDTAPP
jgi:hypothetical protein